MRKFSLLLAGSIALAAAPAALAQTDFLTAKKLSCAPDRMHRCKAPGQECESRDASASDKQQPLILDFEAKKVAMQRGGETRPFGLVLEDKVEGDTRKVKIGRGDDPNTKETLDFVLAKDGKMVGTRDEGKIKMETTCTPVS